MAASDVGQQDKRATRPSRMLSKYYSDLEVVSQGSYGEGIEIAHKGQDKPLPYPGSPQVLYDRNNLPEPHWILGKSTHPIELDGSASHDFPSYPEDKNVEKTRYCCGMTKRMLWVSVAASFVLLAVVVVGGVIGGLKNARHNPANRLSETGANQQGPLSGSKLAALNWTDEDNIERHAVFYQMNGALFLSQAQSAGIGSNQNASWTHLNISDQFVRDGGDLALNPREGTPLAAAATPWQAGNSAPWDSSLAFAVTLYYFNGNNQIRLIWSGAGNLSTWQEGGAWVEVAISSPSATSQMAAVGYYCSSGCLDSMCVAFQGDDATVQCSCSQAFGAFGIPSIITPAFPNSPLALIPFAADYGDNVTYDSELAVFFLDNNEVNILVYNHDDDGAWDPSSSASTTMTSQAQTNGTLPQIAASASDALANILAVSLTGDGNITAGWYQPATNWNSNQPSSFVNEGGNSTSSRPDLRLSAIAMNEDHRLYGLLADGTGIVEYAWSSDNPYKFIWMSSIEVT
ncbi:hypothetical protein N431DRAFT_547768 [Stipitochalara longipes BDJ]|nr:hypothetical protein N431DRAFT_547768 [Stipitochalara longipes BDJ]